MVLLALLLEGKSDHFRVLRSSSSDLTREKYIANLHLALVPASPPRIELPRIVTTWRLRCSWEVRSSSYLTSYEDHKPCSIDLFQFCVFVASCYRSKLFLDLIYATPLSFLVPSRILVRCSNVLFLLYFGSTLGLRCTHQAST